MFFLFKLINYIGTKLIEVVVVDLRGNVGQFLWTTKLFRPQHGAEIDIQGKGLSLKYYGVWIIVTSIIHVSVSLQTIFAPFLVARSSSLIFVFVVW